MTVAFVSHPSTQLRPPASGLSVNIWTYQVARRLSKDCNVLVYSSSAPGTPKESFHHDGVTYVLVRRTLNDLMNRVERVAKRGLRWAHLRTRDRTPFAAWTKDLGYIAAVAWDLRRRGCDIVHLHNYSQFVPILRRLVPGVRIVLHMHCEWLTQVDRDVIAPRLRETDLIVGCSQYITDRVRKAFPEYADRCKTAYNGVDVARYQPTGPSAGSESASDDAFRILFMSRVSPEKGVHVLLDAMQRVKHTIPNVQLDIVGGQFSAPYEYIVGISDDPLVKALSAFYPQNDDWRDAYMAALNAQVKDGLSEHVTFLGAIPHEEVGEYYSRADVVVAPSLSEAFGMSVAEAMASSVPVVVSEVGGLPEVVGKSGAGLVVPPADPESLAAALTDLYTDPERRAGMGRRGRRRVSRLFAWDRVADRLLSDYNVLLEPTEVGVHEGIPA